LTIILPLHYETPNPLESEKLYKQGYCSVAMCLVSYLSPTDVSFREIKVGQGTCNGIGTGSLASQTGKEHPRWQESVSTGNIALGCRVEGPNIDVGQTPYDFISFAIKNVTIAEGTFTWNIPWEYHYNTEVTNKSFVITPGKVVLDGKKGVTVSISGNSVQHTSP
jgi:hypothetical protein